MRFLNGDRKVFYSTLDFMKESSSKAVDFRLAPFGVHWVLCQAYMLHETRFYRPYKSC